VLQGLITEMSRRADKYNDIPDTAEGCRLLNTLVPIGFADENRDLPFPEHNGRPDYRRKAAMEGDGDDRR
jgi:hypothetical protein